MKIGTFCALALCSQLSGCFVFIPGSVVGAISDGITGDKGAHCVGAAAKVGDKIRLPDGALYTVTSLSGTSMRCQQAGMPIRAELAPLQDRAAILADASLPLPTAPEPTDADRAAACQAMAAVKPGAPQAEYRVAWAGLNKLGMTWRDCQKKPV